MQGPLLNFILPVLFIASIGLIIYAIILLIRSFKNRSKQLRLKALKIIIAPLLYITIAFTVFATTNRRFYSKVLPQIPGTYRADSGHLAITLRKDRTCTFS